MAAPRYYYNEKTLRYERARTSINSILFTVSGVLLTGCLFLAGLLFLQNRIVTTPTEKALRDENKALKQHHDILSTRIAASKVKLASLVTREEDLTRKFFDVASTAEPQQAPTSLLLQDKQGFDSELESLNKQYQRLLDRAWKTNSFFSSATSLKRDDLKPIMSFPGLIPIEKPNAELLVSGYGTRINPWHKGKFHHDGVDFAGTRGDNVLSAGDGTVSLLKRSELTAGFGNYIEVDHGKGFVTRYAHLGEIKVRQGQRIKKGQVLGLIGVSGGSIAPHLHYEVLKDGHHIDPMRVLVEGISSNQFHLMAEAAGRHNQTLD
jgi:murein DD-endopeptidase MepM/ murein hydrolase activator NlpD